MTEFAPEERVLPLEGKPHFIIFLLVSKDEVTKVVYFSLKKLQKRELHPFTSVELRVSQKCYHK